MATLSTNYILPPPPIGGHAGTLIIYQFMNYLLVIAYGADFYFVGRATYTG
ncbi:hypothetical protein MUP77_11265 [Candidatus Bathyarchaeota archaeon]|nr:hypothetical protein [Candidatus Bathyarchaeota archaeon]